MAHSTTEPILPDEVRKFVQAKASPALDEIESMTVQELTWTMAFVAIIQPKLFRTIRETYAKWRVDH